MPQSFAAAYLHLVFSTKGRQPFLKDRELRKALSSYMAGISKSLGCEPVEINAVEDHVHVLAALGRTRSIADWVKELKRVSSLWLHQQGNELGQFQWQSGYGVFSVSQSNLQKVIEYIQRQEEHHRQMTFQDEYRTLLRKHHIEFDERYVWD